MAVVLNIFTAFPIFNLIKNDIRSFVFSNFIPASGKVVEEYIQTFIEHTSQLTTVGIVALIITALLMLRTIDNSLNQIWRTQPSTAFLRNFIVYWTILTLGPFLVGVGLILTSYLMSLTWLDGDQTLSQRFLIWLPFLSTSIAFTLLYLLIPNRNVPWFSALTGGLFAAMLFEFSKRGFAFYILNYNVYETIYGTMSTIPIFLVWIYLSWIIILLGAEFAYCLSTFKLDEKYGNMHDHDNYFIQSYRLLGHLWQAQQSGQALSILDLTQQEGWKNEELTYLILEKLKKSSWVYQTDSKSWGLARDLNTTQLVELYYLMIPAGLSKLPEKQDDVWSKNLYPILNKINNNNQDIMSFPLSLLYSDTTHKL